MTATTRLVGDCSRVEDVGEFNATIVRMFYAQAIEDEVLRNVRVVVAEEIGYEMARVVRAKLLMVGEDGPSITYPSDWWSAFRIKWFPEWANEKWPPQRTVIRLTFVYPDIPLPDRLGRTMVSIDGLPSGCEGAR